MRESRAGETRRRPAPRPDSAFTLVELVVVMVLLGIAAAYVAPHMVAFFRGRILASEARRLVSLAHLGQSRAVAEGVPVMLWIDPSTSTLGLTTRPGRPDLDDEAVTYTADSSVTLETAAPDPQPQSEDGDERLGVPAGLAVIRFLPGGGFDPASPSRIVLRQGDGGSATVAPGANHLSYELAAPGR